MLNKLQCGIEAFGGVACQQLAYKRMLLSTADTVDDRMNRVDLILGERLTLSRRQFQQFLGVYVKGDRLNKRISYNIYIYTYIYISIYY